MYEESIELKKPNELDGGPLFERGLDESKAAYDNSPHSDDNAPINEKGFGVPVRSERFIKPDDAVKDRCEALTDSQKRTVDELSAAGTRDARMVLRAINGGWPITPAMKEAFVAIVMRILRKGVRPVVHVATDGTKTVEYVPVSERTYAKAMDAMVRMVQTNASLMPQVHELEMTNDEPKPARQLDLTKLTDQQLDFLHEIYKSQEQDKAT